MAVTLFPHNQAAYDAVIDMLAETGRACVIHPTGTGKSIIGFRYVDEHPNERILWLAPSEYIFRTQMENWRAAGGSELPNLTFFTYAKLMMTPPEDMRRMDMDRNGMRLGLWICNLRRRRNQGRLRLSDGQKRRLDALGMRWENRQDAAWDRAYNAAKLYWERHGDLNVPREYSIETGFKLGRWVRRQRKSWKDGMLPEMRKERLNAIGMQW